MNNFIKITIRILPVFAILVLAYVLYLNYYGDRSQNWFGGRYSKADIIVESKKANAFFERYYDTVLTMSPQLQSSLGIKTQQDKWDDLSEEAAQKRYEFNLKNLKYLQDSLRTEGLDSTTSISFLLLEKQLEQEIEGFKYRHFDYPVNQMHGLHTESISFLINSHPIDNEKDALDYLKRLNGLDLRINQILEQLQLREATGAIPPRFLFPKLIDDCVNIVSGAPLNPGLKKNVIYEDFENKLNRVADFDSNRKKILLDNCKAVLQNTVLPAYGRLINYLRNTETKAISAPGLWKMKEGEECYAFRLKEQSSSDLSPEAIYDLGNDEIQRIQSEMGDIIKKLNFRGDLQEFFKFMRESQQFYYPNSPAGKAEYLKKATAIIDSMRLQLPKLFNIMPKAAITVKAVESYREMSAGKAFYEVPAPDGSRPGHYYVNTFDMRIVPKYQMEALAYHEGIPGHHLQLALAQEMTNLPRFRRYSQDYNAYVEGWGLYAELLPKEIGFYKDPYSDFGRLAMELWRACRLVVDVGIHSKRWTREQAIQFYKNNTPNSEADCIKMVDRHIVMPGQAAAYKIGMMAILELREKSKKELGDKFDIRDFHDVVLKNGAVPLSVLEDLVMEYIKNNKR